MFRSFFQKNSSSEFEQAMSALPGYSVNDLELMHQVLLKYSMKRPIPFGASDPDEYLDMMNNFENSKIPGGPVYGCRTYGEAVRMNHAIVKLLDEME